MIVNNSGAHLVDQVVYIWSVNFHWYADCDSGPDDLFIQLPRRTSLRSLDIHDVPHACCPQQ